MNIKNLFFLAIAFSAFYGLTHLGELVQSKNSIMNMLFIDNMKIYPESQPPCILISLPLAKTRNSAYSDILVIHQSYDALCPMKILLSYIKTQQNFSTSTSHWTWI